MSSSNGHKNVGTPDEPRREGGHEGGHSLVRQTATAKAKLAVIAAYTGQVEGVSAGIVTDACEHAGIHRSTFYDWLKDDDDFRVAFEHAEERAADLLEREARRRGVEGVERPLVSMGRLVMVKVEVIEDGRVRTVEQPLMVREYSDRMLELLLTGRRGRVFGNRRLQVQHSGGLDLNASKPEEVTADFVADVVRELNSPGEVAAGEDTPE